MVKAKKRVFLSFLAEDADHIRGLRLLKDNPNYELDFYDESVREPINSERAEYIKQKIREKISRASVTVCLISEKTYTSEWVNWELEESHKKGNKIIAMALKGVKKAVLPKLIRELGLKFYEWNPDYLNQLIQED